MQVDPSPVLKNIQSLYLNPHGADVWFKINDERVPGHKLILSAMSPYYSKMFYGSLPENSEVNMTDAVRSVESFKEFLKFMYTLQPNLTMNNIEDVISLAKQSLSDECMSVCGVFLRKSLTTENMFRIYQVALLYDIHNLKAICEDEICVVAEKVLRSSSLLEFPYDYLHMVLKRDALACEEVDIFNACIAWAKAACKRLNLDPSNGVCLRDQLRASVYQIRFTSMSTKEASDCIRLCPGLFTADELEEIICMVAQEDKFQPKQFNWTPRYFDLNCYKGRNLQFSRVKKYRFITEVKRRETTRFSCNRRVLLKSIYCEIDSLERPLVHVTIKESRDNENEIDRYDQRLIVHFAEQVNRNYKAEIVLNKSILLRPMYHYDICIEFDSSLLRYTSIYTHGILATKKRIDHDIVFHFEPNGIVSGLSIYRFDKKNYLQKVFCNPKVWMMLAIVVAVVVLSIRSTYIIIEADVVQQSLFDHLFG